MFRLLFDGAKVRQIFELTKFSNKFFEKSAFCREFAIFILQNFKLSFKEYQK